MLISYSAESRFYIFLHYTVALTIYTFNIRVFQINELENEYLAFISKENCKIAQSIILRSLVLTVLKKLSSSTQVREVYSHQFKCSRHC